jgi:intracellular septation protein
MTTGENLTVSPADNATADVHKQLIRLAVDLGPLAVFFLSNALLGIYWATGVCMAAMLASLAFSRLALGRMPVMLLVTTLFVLVFGGLTIFLHDDTFIKIKPTILDAMFAAILLIGLAFNQLYVKALLGEALHLADKGWRKFQFRWGLFFVGMALLNEIVRREFSTDIWVTFKFFAIYPLSIAFMLSQMGLIRAFSIEEQGSSVRGR